jgi:hypothetical protein
VASLGNVLVIGNVNARRVAIGFIVWLDLILAIQRVSHQFHFVAVRVEHHLMLRKRNNGELGSLKAVIQGK